MRKILLLMCCIIPTVLHAQKPEDANKFKVIDAATNLPIPYTPISILRAGLAIATEADGTFYIPGNLAAMRDTIVFSAQTYAELKLPLNKLATMTAIRLNKATGKKSLTPALYSAKMILNDHLMDDVGYYAGISTESATFNYLQMAQRFVTNAQNNRLTNITIHKRQHWMRTKFRVRVYDIDPATGGPGADLCDQVIDVDNEDDVNIYLNSHRTGSVHWSYVAEGRKNVIDLRKYNIIIPNRSFFVAVEWLRDFFNGVKAPVYDRITNRVDTTIVFRPYIGISPVKGQKLNIWVMEPNRAWKIYDHFYPVGTDLAIKAAVEY